MGEDRVFGWRFWSFEPARGRLYAPYALQGNVVRELNSAGEIVAACAHNHTKKRLLPADEAHYRVVGDRDIGSHGPNRMMDNVTDVSRQIAFNDMARRNCRIRQSKQCSASLRSAKYRCNDSGGDQIVTGDSTPTVDWVEVVSPVLSCEFLVGRNHLYTFPHLREQAQRFRRAANQCHMATVVSTT
jgi:hypothetical protein